MPPPLKLVGRRFGKLLVIAQGETHVSPSGKSRTTRWVCRCDCGREETIMEQRIPHTPTNAARVDAVYACEHCRSQRICMECGERFESRLYMSTCSPECKLDLARRRGREFKRALAAADPDYNKNQNEAKRRRAAADPAVAARAAEAQAASSARKKARAKEDAAYAEHVREQARRRYAERAEQVLARRKERHDLLSPEQKADLADRNRELGRLWRKKWRETPEGRRLSAERSAEQQRRRSLGKLLQIGAKLVNKLDNKDE